MIDCGCQLAAVLEPGAVLFLEGELGAGKTTFTRGILRALGHEGAVKSPTYTLVEPYLALQPPCYHFDLYRLGDPEELEYMGIRDYFDGRAVAVLEWPERGGVFLPAPDLRITIALADGARVLRMRAESESGNGMLAALDRTVTE